MKGNGFSGQQERSRKIGEKRLGSPGVLLFTVGANKEKLKREGKQVREEKMKEKGKSEK